MSFSEKYELLLSSSLARSFAIAVTHGLRPELLCWVFGRILGRIFCRIFSRIFLSIDSGLSHPMIMAYSYQENGAEFKGLPGYVIFKMELTTFSY